MAEVMQSGTNGIWPKHGSRGSQLGLTTPKDAKQTALASTFWEPPSFLEFVWDAAGFPSSF